MKKNQGETLGKVKPMVVEKYRGNRGTRDDGEIYIGKMKAGGRLGCSGGTKRSMGPIERLTPSRDIKEKKERTH